MDGAAAWTRPEQLMQKSARAMANSTDPVERLRLQCLSRGASTILGLGRVFRRMDEDGSKQLDKQEFYRGIQETGLQLSDEEAELLFEKFDTNLIPSTIQEKNTASYLIANFMYSDCSTARTLLAR